MTRRRRLPPWLRLRVKEWLCEFTIIGSMVIEQDDRMKARERIDATSKRPWLLRYARRLTLLRITGSAYDTDTWLENAAMEEDDPV